MYICDIKPIAANGFTNHVTKMYGREEVKLHAFLILGLDKWSSSRYPCGPHLQESSLTLEDETYRLLRNVGKKLQSQKATDLMLELTAPVNNKYTPCSLHFNEFYAETIMYQCQTRLNTPQRKDKCIYGP